MYSPQVLDHFQNPRGVGDLANPTVTVELQNPACGDVLRLSLLIVNHQILQARIRAKGCVPTIACASRLAEYLNGSTVAAAQELNERMLVDSIGGLPQASRHAGALAIEALRSALSNI